MDRELTSTSYTVPAGRQSAEIREKGSRFLAILEPASDEAHAKDQLATIRRAYPDATHHCWAWRVGPDGRERCSDDGEPSGTAGSPMLRILGGSGLTEVLAVVVRWYGGTKLGKGGLARAYAGAVREALVDLPTRVQLTRTTVALTIPYSALGAVQRLVHPPELEILTETYGESIQLTLAATVEKLAGLEELTAGLGLELTPLPSSSTP